MAKDYDVLTQFSKCLIDNSNGTFSLRTTGALSIGDTVIGGTNNLFLYIDNTGKLANSSYLGVLSTNGKIMAGLQDESVTFFPTNDTIFQVARNITSIGTSGSPLDITKFPTIFVTKVTPSAATGSGIGATIYASAGFNVNLHGSYAYNGGFPIGNISDAMSALGAFGQVQIYTNQTVDGVGAFLFTTAHKGAGSATTNLKGGVFYALTDDESSPLSPTGSVSNAIAVEAAVGVGGCNVTNAESARFYEPAIYDAGNGYLSAVITNKTALRLRGSYSIDETVNSSASTIDSLSVDTSYFHFTGNPTLRGISHDTYNKVIFFTFSNGITIADNHATPATGDKIKTGTGANLTGATDGGGILVYDTNGAFWRIVSWQA